MSSEIPVIRKSIDGKEFINKDAYDSMASMLMKMVKLEHAPAYRSFAVLCGTSTQCRIDFDGPVSLKEFDELINQLTAYKKFIPDKYENPEEDALKTHLAEERAKTSFGKPGK